MSKITVIFPDSLPHKVIVPDPKICPCCNYGIQPQNLFVSDVEYIKNAYSFIVVHQCPNCSKYFITEYIQHADSIHGIDLSGFGARPYTIPFKISISNESSLTDISERFLDVYKQSLMAEHYGLHHLVGMGLRKALEYLLQDYLSIINPNDIEKINNSTLSQNIKLIPNENLRSLATASNWLGNDHVHTSIKWPDKDISDLKTFIEALTHLLLMELSILSAKEMISRKSSNGSTL